MKKENKDRHSDSDKKKKDHIDWSKAFIIVYDKNDDIVHIGTSQDLTGPGKAYPSVKAMRATIWHLKKNISKGKSKAGYTVVIFPDESDRMILIGRD